MAKQRIIKHSIAFGLSNAITKAINILLIPLYTRFFSVEEFGIFSISLTFYYIFNMVFKAGASSIMFKEYFENTNNNFRKSLIGSTYIYQISITIALMLIILSFMNLLDRTIIHSNSSFIILIIFATAASESLVSIPLSVLRAQEKSKIFGLFMIFQAILIFVFTYVFIVMLDLKIFGAFLAMMIAKLFCFLAASIKISKIISFKFNISIVKELFLSGWPLVFSGIAGWIITMSDKIIISLLKGPYETGLYSLSEKIGSVMSIAVFTPFSLLWGFESLKIYYNENWKLKFENYFLYILGVSVLLGMTLSLFISEIINIAGTNEYIKTSIVASPIILALILNILTRFHTFFLTVKRKNHIASIITLVGALINIILNILLIKYVDFRAAAFSTLLSFFIIYILTYNYVKKELPFNHNPVKTILLVIIFGINSYVGFVIKEINIMNFILKLFILLPSAIILIKLSNLGIILKSSASFLKSFFKKTE